jgi:hypothetical protein
VLENPGGSVVSDGRVFGGAYRRQGAAVPLLSFAWVGEPIVTAGVKIGSGPVFLVLRPKPDHKNESMWDMKFAGTSQDG